jgi:hydroxybutyrate-dimer hydrolase
VEFAFYVLNQRFGAELPDGRRTVVVTPANTLVIASSVSNGAAASLAAAEQDTAGWIDGIAVSEPNVNVANGTAGVRVERGASIYTAGSKPLYDYFTLANQLQPCAALAPSVAVASPFAFTGNNATIAALRCEALAAQGLVTGTTAAERGADALNTLIAYGWEPETAVLQASHWLFATPGIAVTYANTYGQFSVRSNTCGFSFGSVDASGVPIAAAPAAIAGVFGTGNGVPPSGALQLIWNDSVGGARNHIASVSPSGKADFALPGANCLRGLWTAFGADALAVRAGVAAVQRSANLRGKPTIIVHGRSDTLIPPNFSSRPYVARNRAAEGAASRVRYIEVTNAQHFDAFLPFAGYDTRYVPLHLYFNRAMDAMWAHLKNGAALPPSQVVRTTPRGGTPGAAPAITAANVPAIAASPAAGALITVTDDGSTIRIPD